jgi:hypothetical protein
MTTQVLDGTVAVLWGSETREVNWVLLSPKDGRVSVARAHAGGFWVRDVPGAPGVTAISGQAAWAWQQIRAGADLADQATHRLAPPHMQIIEPIHPETHKEGQ